MAIPLFEFGQWTSDLRGKRDVNTVGSFPQGCLGCPQHLQETEALPKEGSSVQLLSRVRLFVTPWTTVHQASLSITNSQSLLKLMSIVSRHPTVSSSVVPFSSCLQSVPASGSFPMSQFFVSGGQSIGVSASASVLPMNIQD